MGDISTGGPWQPDEAQEHINSLEIYAAYFTLKSFLPNIGGKHVKISIDNTCAVSVLNNMGTCHSEKCNDIATKIWGLCEENNMWLTAAHIPGPQNITADYESRNFNMDIEWMLNPKILTQALQGISFSPTIDMFASRLNKQFPQYVSYRPDPFALHIDAFTISWADKQFYCFPPFSCVLKVIRKVINDKGRGILVVPYWPTQSWFPLLTTILEQHPTILQPSKNLLLMPSNQEQIHPPSQDVTPGYLSSIRAKLQVDGFSVETIEIILSLWRTGTLAQYQGVYKKWYEFCSKNKCDVICPQLPLALRFLSELFKDNLSYSYINTARSALSSLIIVKDTDVPFGQLPVVKRFMKGVFEKRPALPKYHATWNVSVVFKFIREQKPVDETPLKELTQRLTFLLCLLSGQRSQTIHKLSLENMCIGEEKVTFFITEKLKHTRQGVHQQPLEFLAYKADRKLCIVTHIQHYVEKTSSLRQEEKQLLISFIKPHKAVSKDTVSNWIKHFMKTAGIDTSVYKSHSTRAAATSYLASKQVDVNDILAAAGWSNEETFQKFYNRNIIVPFNFGNALLEASVGE